MRYTLVIDCDNAAFEGPDGWHELGRILRRAAAIAENGIGAGDEGNLRDINGNRVGWWEFTEATFDDKEDPAPSAPPKDAAALAADARSIGAHLATDPSVTGPLAGVALYARWPDIVAGLGINAALKAAREGFQEARE